MKIRLSIILLVLVAFSTYIKADDNPEKKKTTEWYFNLGLNMGGPCLCQSLKK